MYLIFGDVGGDKFKSLLWELLIGIFFFLEEIGV